MSELSIVIPCYNARESIIRALESLENNYVNVEVIIVEDCSLHSSEDLIREFTKKKSLDIKYLINDKNLGAGRTRNIGIRAASKEYITFLDSDDEFSQLYFKEIKKLLEDGYDEIIYNAERVFNYGSQTMSMFFSDRIHEGEISKEDALVFVKGCTCGKIYKTEIIKNNNVEFGMMPRNEDMVFTKVATSYMEKIYFIQSPLYIYRDTDSSLMNDSSLVTPQNAIDAFEIVSNKCLGRNLEKELNSLRFIEVLYSTTNSLIKLNKSKADIRRNYKENRKQYNKRDPYRKKYSKVYRLSYIMFEMGLFGLYKILRSTLKSR